MTLNANHWQWANEAFNRDWADDARDPAQDITARYAIEQTLDDIAAARAALSDANHLLYLVRANQTFMAGYGDSLEAGLAAIEAPTLMLYSENDLVFAPEGVRRTAELIEADGTEVTLETLEGNRGHLDGVVAIEQASDTLRAFLESRWSAGLQEASASEVPLLSYGHEVYEPLQLADAPLTKP